MKGPLYIISKISYGDELVRVVHHGNKKVEEDNNVNESKASQHDYSPKPCELLHSGYFDRNYPDQQGLWGFSQTEIASYDRKSVKTIFNGKIIVFRAMIEK